MSDKNLWDACKRIAKERDKHLAENERLRAALQLFLDRHDSSEENQEVLDDFVCLRNRCRRKGDPQNQLRGGSLP